MELVSTNDPCIPLQFYSSVVEPWSVIPNIMGSNPLGAFFFTVFSCHQWVDRLLPALYHCDSRKTLMQYQTPITDIWFIWIWTALSMLVITVNWFSGYRNRTTVKNALQTLYITLRCWLRDTMLNTNRGIYDYWKEMPGHGQLSPLKVEENNTEIRPILVFHFNFFLACDWIKHQFHASD